MGEEEALLKVPSKHVIGFDALRSDATSLTNLHTAFPAHQCGVAIFSPKTFIWVLLLVRSNRDVQMR